MKRNFCCEIFFFIRLQAASTPATATDAVPWMSSLKVQ